jgi:hypothetical protein
VFEIALDKQCIFIEKEKETTEFADYFFVCNVWNKDPRYKARRMISGQRRGLFRVQKPNLSVELLFPMDLEGSDYCFRCAANKVLKLYGAESKFPDMAQYVIG